MAFTEKKTSIENRKTRYLDRSRDFSSSARTGSPLPDPIRAQACTAIIAGGEFVLVDTGSGSWRKVAVNSLPAQNLSAILITHFHSDHIGDLGEALMQSWAAGRNHKLDVYGPPEIGRAHV